MAPLQPFKNICVQGLFRGDKGCRQPTGSALRMLISTPNSFNNSPRNVVNETPHRPPVPLAAKMARATTSESAGMPIFSSRNQSDPSWCCRPTLVTRSSGLFSVLTLVIRTGLSCLPWSSSVAVLYKHYISSSIQTELWECFALFLPLPFLRFRLPTDVSISSSCSP